MENLHIKKCIRTFSGKYINVFDPDPETILIEDIAHASANLCRWGGHCPEFYSVGQHAVHCSELADEKDKLAMLLHDASESLGLLDFPRPIKNEFKNYLEIEDNLMRIIAKKFGFQYPLTENMKKIDDIMLNKEWEDLILKPSMECWSPVLAKNIFLQTFDKLNQ